MRRVVTLAAAFPSYPYGTFPDKEGLKAGGIIRLG